MKLCIYGAGAMGTVLGAHLARAGVPVDLVSRNEAHIAALKAHGAQIVGKTEFSQSVCALLPSELSARYDLIFLMTKQRQNEETVRSLLPFLSENGVICTLQNGLPEYSVAAVVGADRTLGCTVAWGANLVAPGKAELTSEPSAMTFSLGAFGDVSNRLLADIAAVLSHAGRVTVTDRLEGARWAKLLLNAAFSGLSAVTGCSFGELARLRRCRRAVLSVMRETVAIASACGVCVEPIQGYDVAKLVRSRNPFSRALVWLLLPVAMRRHRDLVSGMLLDLRRGRRTDVDFVNGAVCAAAKRAGVRAPYNEKIVELVHGIENGLFELSLENLDFLPLGQERCYG